MNHAVNVWMCLEDLVEVVLLADIDIEEFRPLATDELDTIDDFLRCVEKVVGNDDFVPIF